MWYQGRIVKQVVHFWFDGLFWEYRMELQNVIFGQLIKKRQIIHIDRIVEAEVRNVSQHAVHFECRICSKQEAVNQRENVEEDLSLGKRERASISN